MVVFSHQINTAIYQIYNIDVQKELSSPILDSVVRKSNLFLWETFWRFSPRFIGQQRAPILLLLLNKHSFHQWDLVRLGNASHIQGKQSVLSFRWLIDPTGGENNNTWLHTSHKNLSYNDGTIRHPTKPIKNRSIYNVLITFLINFQLECSLTTTFHFNLIFQS